MLERLHDALRQIDMAPPPFTDRLAGIQRWLSDSEVTPDLVREDRQLLVQRLEPSSRLLAKAAEREQLLHGEPHPWNVFTTVEGPVFIDFENCARGPVEYDLAWVPTAVSNRYPGLDRELLDECRGLVLALVAAHRWRRDDQHPSGRPSGIAFLNVLCTGPPWPALDEVSPGRSQATSTEPGQTPPGTARSRRSGMSSAVRTACSRCRVRLPDGLR